MTLTRRIKKQSAKREVELQRVVGQLVTLDALLFGSAMAPTDEFLEQRREFICRFRALMVEFGAKNPASLRDYLYDAYKTYDIDKNGPSKAMTFVWDIETLKELEAEHAKAAGSGRE